MTGGHPPAVSVVIPTHGGRFVADAVASVTAQTFRDWELVIVDDASQDGTAARAAGWAAADRRIRVVTSARNEGIVAARNRGFAAASPAAPHVAFLDHDDLWMPEALAVLVAALDAQPGAAAAHGTAIIVDDSGQRRPTHPTPLPARRMGLEGGKLVAWPPERPTEFANLVVEDCVVSVGSGLVRRACVERLAGFDPRAERAEDYDFWIRVSRLGPIAFVDHPVMALRLHDGQTSRRRPLPHANGLSYVRYKLIASPDNTPEQRRLAVAGYRARQRQLLGQRWSSLREQVGHRDYSRVPGTLADAASSALHYVRGRPWSWHR